MLSYCLKSSKNTESKNPKVVITKNRTMTLLSNYAFYRNKNPDRDSLLKIKKLVDYY